MKIQVQELIQKPQSRQTLIELNSEILTLKETILEVLSPVIDHGSWAKLNHITAKSRSMQRLSAYSEREKTRHEDILLLADGKNIIEVIDFTEQSRKIVHDPIIRIIGVDAVSISKIVMEGIIKKLSKKIFNVDKNVLNDLSNIFKRKIDVKALVKEVEEEAEMLVKKRIHESTTK